MIHIENLVKRYGDLIALDHLLDLRNMQKNVPENCPAVFLEDSTLPAVLPTSQSLSSWTNQR